MAEVGGTAAAEAAAAAAAAVEEEDSNVYFRFEGSVEDGITPATVSIPKKALLAEDSDDYTNDGDGDDDQRQEHRQPTMLCALAKDAWKRDETIGATHGNPITTSPLDSACADEWYPELAQMIADAYKVRLEILESKKETAQNEQGQEDQNQANRNDEGAQQEAQQGNQDGNEGQNDRGDEVGAENEQEELKPPSYSLKLPSSNDIELEEVYIVLDYYGLDINAMGITIDMSEVSDIIRVRGKLFLKEYPLVEECKDFIINHLNEKPNRETYFLFLGHEIHIDEVNSTVSVNTEPEPGSQEPGNETVEINSVQFVRAGKVGPPPSPINLEPIHKCDHFRDAMKVSKNRQVLISFIENMGFQASFVSNFFSKAFDEFSGINHSYGRVDTGEFPNEGPSDGKSWVTAQNGLLACDDGYLNTSLSYCELYVLKVDVPEAEPRFKRRRVC